eukprot:12532656-Alexandrium_andersonii.AAC.1
MPHSSCCAPWPSRAWTHMPSVTMPPSARAKGAASGRLRSSRCAPWSSPMWSHTSSLAALPWP